jgi:hypothetical protein
MNLRALFALALLLPAAPLLAQMTETMAAPEAGALLAPQGASLFAAPAPAQSTLVPIQGLVSGSPESVSFSGQAKVSNRLAPDPDFNRPRYVLTIDLTGVTGVGSNTGTKYVIAGPELVQRGAAATYAIEITFPFKSSTSTSAVIARSGVASFALDFDVNSGAITSASGNVSTPNFPR